MSRQYHLFLSLCLITVACKDRNFNNSVSVTSTSTLERGVVPPRFPDATSSYPWGGPDVAKWKAEAVFSNAIGAAFNAAWLEPDIADVFVSVPTHFSYGKYNPYGDGQINTAMDFSSAWTLKRPQVIAVLKHFKNQKPSKLMIRIDRALVQNQSAIEILFQETQSSQPIKFLSAASRTPEGDLQTEIEAPGIWNVFNKTQDQRYEASAALATALIRPSGQFNDWFPIHFRHPVSSAERLKKTVDPKTSLFSASAPVPFPAQLDDPVGLMPRDSSENAFSKALKLEIDKKWPASFNNEHFTSCNVHGDFAMSWDDANARRAYPTAVGRNWTWLTNPENVLNQQKQGPFKILYTCFEPRRVNPPTQDDSSCVGQPTAGPEAAHGVPSGAGWHLIGDPAETLFNSVEKNPLMMASGFVAPHERIAMAPPTGGIAYALKDVAVARWLQPGEAFLTARSKDSARPNFHWFLFHSEEHVCTLGWVHPCVPDDQREPNFGGVGCR